MKQEIYYEVLKSVEKLCNDDDWSEKLIALYPEYKKFTLCSIYSQSMQKRVKKTYHKIAHPDTATSSYQRYIKALEVQESPGILLRLAKEYVFSPAMLAKIILEHQLSLSVKADGISGVTKSQVNKLLRDTTQIQDRDLSYEVYLCLLHDDVYGPFADSIKHSLGHEYEFLLRLKLDELNIGYLDEDGLRSRGYDKTPDIKLDIPIAIDGKVINWIESKASFGDEDSHRNYLKDQFWSYWNRFGPGLVIYWFGFIDELDEHSEKGILLRDHFPTNITFMEPRGKPKARVTVTDNSVISDSKILETVTDNSVISDSKILETVTDNSIISDSKILETVTDNSVISDSKILETVTDNSIISDSKILETVTDNSIISDSKILETVTDNSVIADSKILETVTDNSVISDSKILETVTDNSIISDSKILETVTDNSVIADSKILETVTDNSVIADSKILSPVQNTDTKLT